ncbi:AI-2E family transporter [Flavobacterium sp. MAH-1]|uniref:AI-2E family transporter n=1 Tax=Flavobacterium agri TaxID=2743471 RepID=A0A7Y9C4W9_9FLAO|nr:AI-2E family transporter [Flavobacterium agri]NUY80310.1 AI-2E family transporter [Flavobacterium agri]NYA70335.1 AI-2E family transporter [Flavobacterium agri]
MTRTEIPPYIKAVFLSLLIIIIIFVMVMARKILIPLMVSGYIAMLLTSFCNRLEKYKMPRSLAAFIALFFASLALIGFLYFVVTQVGNFATDVEANMQTNLNTFATRADDWVQNTTGFDMQMERGFDLKKMFSLVQSDDKAMTDFLMKTLGTLSDIVLLPVFIFFLLIYRDHLAVFVSKVFRKQKDSDLLEQIASLRKVVHNYLIGAGKVMLILGVVNTGVLFALGIKHAIFFGMLAGFLNIIPYLGPSLGAILPFVFALLTKDSLFYPFAVVVSFTLIQFLESAYLTPRITGANVNLNAFVTFLGLLIGGAIWGIPGMILIIPTIAILKKLFELSPETEPYAYLFGEEDSRWFRRHKP